MSCDAREGRARIGGRLCRPGAVRRRSTRGTPRRGPQRRREEQSSVAILRAVGNLAQFALVTLTSVLFIVDPIAVIPTYLVITQAQTSEQRAKTAQRACVAAALILIAFALFGTLIFEIFGITIEAFRIASGLILWVVAMEMLHGQRT